MIVLIGYLTGCKDIEEIHFSAEVCEEMLRKYLELPNGIPSADTILRVLAGIDGKELEKAHISRISGSPKLGLYKLSIWS